MAEDEGKKMEPPPGIVPLMITMKPMEAMGLKTGPGLKDTVAFKTFNTEEVKAEIIAKGFYSAFHPVRAEIDVRSCWPYPVSCPLSQPLRCYRNTPWMRFLSWRTQMKCMERTGWLRSPRKRTIQRWRYARHCQPRAVPVLARC